MSSSKLVIQAAAGAAGGEALNVEEVFSTYLYTGNGTDDRAINNGIDLSGEGGMVWIKNRDFAFDHLIGDTERGITKGIRPNNTVPENNFSDRIKSATSTGFTIGTADEINSSNTGYTGSLMNYASWTFRKAPKFFTCLTYTGTGVNRTISHDLGSTPGMIIVKRTDSTSDWACYHRGLNGGTNPATKFIRLNLSNAESGNTGYWNNTAPTDSVFTVGSNAATNANGGTYVAYLFAHNDDDGDFGPDSDADIIKCGSYTGGGSSAPPTIDLGFEPQWVLVKSSSVSGTHWYIVDAMRGLVVGSNDAYLTPSATDAEGTAAFIEPTATGFKVAAVNSSYINGSGQTYIYIAIRRGPMAVPESATDVFDVNEATNPRGFVTTGFPVDLHMQRKLESGDGFNLADRLRGELKFLYTTETSSEYTFSSTFPAEFDHMDGIDNYSYSSQTKDTIFYNWKRAPNYFDITCHTGNGQPTQQINHNLGVVPEMAWIKARNNSNAWFVYHKDLTSGKNLILNTTAAETTSNANTAAAFYDTYWTPGDNGVLSGGGNTVTYIAYLFASLDGVSKVGSYTGTGAAQNIDCGFSSGARFVLIRRTDISDNWEVFDTERGIVAGNDPRLLLEDTAAQYTSKDFVDPYSSGFAVTTELSKSSGTYIFYAIA